MPRATGPLLVTLLVLQVLAVALVPAPADAQGEIVIASGETVVWADGGRDITGRVSVSGTLIVRDYELEFKADVEGGASIWVNPGGVLRFQNSSLLPKDDSDYFVLSVEGRFEARDSVIEYLTGEFITGGGVKCVDGQVELWNTTVGNCKVQAVYAEGLGASVVVDHCNITGCDYGAHVKDDARLEVRNGTRIDAFEKAGVLVNRAEAEVTNSTLTGIRNKTSQGIAVRGSQVVVADCDVGDVMHEVVELTDDASAGLYNCHIHSADVGVRMMDSSAVMVDCSIYDCGDGLDLLAADPKVRRTRITANENGVTSRDCDPGYQLEDCTIGGNSQVGVLAVGPGLEESGTKWTDLQGEPNGEARIVQVWTLDVNVSDHEAVVIIGATVTVRDEDGQQVFNGTTNSRGSVQGIQLEGYRLLNDGTQETQGRYKVEIVKGERDARKSISMDKSKVLQVALGDGGGEQDTSGRWVYVLLIILVIAAVVAYWWFRVR